MAEENEIDYRTKIYLNALDEELQKRNLRHNVKINGPDLDDENRDELAHNLASFSDKLNYSEGMSEDDIALLNAINYFHLLGYQEMSKALSLVDLRLKLLKEHFPNFLDRDYKAQDSERRRINASGPRNPHVKYAIKIMKATWSAIPDAPQGQMIKLVRDHFGKEKISRISLIRAIKAEGIKPKINGVPRRTSFSLIIPEPD